MRLGQKAKTKENTLDISSGSNDVGSMSFQKIDMLSKTQGSKKFSQVSGITPNTLQLKLYNEDDIPKEYDNQKNSIHETKTMVKFNPKENGCQTTCSVISNLEGILYDHKSDIELGI